MSDEEMEDSTPIESPELTDETVTEVPETETDLEEEDLPLAASAEEEVDGEVTEKETAAYEANYKFNVKGEEHEIDDVLKPLITSKEVEDKIRRLHEQSFGIEKVEESRDYYKENLGQYKGALEKQTGAINTLSSYLDQGDLESFFKALDIPSKDVMQYALTQAQRQEWTPEQRMAYDQQWETKRRANVYQEQYNTNQSHIESLRQDQVVKDYTIELHNPEVQKFAEAYDQLRGSDAFRNEVADLGTYHEKVHGNVLEVSHLVKAVMEKFGPLMQTSGQVATQATGPQTTAPREVPTIPNTGPGGQAPAQKAIRSLEDLEKLAESYG